VTTFHVDSDAVLGAHQNMRACGERIRGEVATMLGHLGALQASWQGQASTAFQGAVTDWRMLQQHVDDSLSALNTALGTAGQQYAEAERANVHLFLR
jgi:6 kDa early secretory antigenic target